MILVKATVKAKNGLRPELLKNVNECTIDTRKEKNCIGYEPFLSVEDENAIVLVEQWVDKESLDEHMKSEHFIKFIESSKELFAGEPTIQLFNVQD